MSNVAHEVPVAKKPCAACAKRIASRPYMGFQEWAEKMARRYHQTQCPKCGRWTIWKRGAEQNQERKP